MIEPLAVGIHAAAQAGIQPDDHVMVIGAGMIGLACVWAAKEAGAATVLATDLEERKLAIAAELGALPVNAREPVGERVRELTGRRHVDRAIDAVGTSETLARAVEVVRRGGTISLVGMGEPCVSLSAYGLTVEERTLRGSFCYSPQHFGQAVSHMVSGTFDTARFIDSRVSLEETPSAFAALAANAAAVKTIVVVTNGPTRAP